MLVLDGVSEVPLLQCLGLPTLPVVLLGQELLPLLPPMLALQDQTI